MKKWTIGLFLIAALSIGVVVFAQMTASDECSAEHQWGFLQSQDYAKTWHFIQDKPMGMYKGAEPHGAQLQTFVNNIAFDAINAKNGEYPYGSIIVKENYSPEGMLGAVTVMQKIKGFNPDAGDWAWVKYKADGEVLKAGKVDGCIGCHAAMAAQDYVWSTTIK